MSRFPENCIGNNGHTGGLGGRRIDHHHYVNNYIAGPNSLGRFSSKKLGQKMSKVNPASVIKRLCDIVSDDFEGKRESQLPKNPLTVTLRVKYTSHFWVYQFEEFFLDKAIMCYFAYLFVIEFTFSCIFLMHTSQCLFSLSFYFFFLNIYLYWLRQ